MRAESSTDVCVTGVNRRERSATCVFLCIPAVTWLVVAAAGAESRIQKTRTGTRVGPWEPCPRPPLHGPATVARTGFATYAEPTITATSRAKKSSTAVVLHVKRRNTRAERARPAMAGSRA
jgi:hypothetical protein